MHKRLFYSTCTHTHTHTHIRRSREGRVETPTYIQHNVWVSFDKVPGGMGWKTLCELQERIALATFERGEVAVLHVARSRRGQNGMIVVYRFDDQPHSHQLIQIQSDPLSRWFRVFLISRLEPFAKVHAPEAGRDAHVMTATDVWEQLDFAIDFVQLLHGDVDFGQGLTETRPPTRQNNIQHYEDEIYLPRTITGW